MYHFHLLSPHLECRHNDDERFWSNATVDTWAKEMAGQRIVIEKYANITDNSVVGLRAPYLRVGGNNQFTMMEEQAFLYDSTITAPLHNPPLWPYTMYFRMPHRCHGNLQTCPTRSHAVWEMVMNELDRREDPTTDEYLPGCAMVDSCSNILTGKRFARYEKLSRWAWLIFPRQAINFTLSWITILNVTTTRTALLLASTITLPGSRTILNSLTLSFIGSMKCSPTTTTSTLSPWLRSFNGFKIHVSLRKSRASTRGRRSARWIHHRRQHAGCLMRANWRQRRSPERR